MLQDLRYCETYVFYNFCLLKIFVGRSSLLYVNYICFNIVVVVKGGMVYGISGGQRLLIHELQKLLI